MSEQTTTLRVVGPGSLMSALVVEYLRAVAPECRIEQDHATGAAPASGVRVVNVATSDWIAVTEGRDGEIAAVEPLSLGACAVATTDSTVEEFMSALRVLLAEASGGLILRLVRQLAASGRTDRPSSDGDVMLTEREREVLHLAAQGYSTREMAELLVVSQNTVRSHLHALAVKLRSSSRARMLVRARALNIPEAFAIHQ